MMKRLDAIRAGGIAGSLILLGILVALNMVLRPVRIRADMTEEKLYTLSDGTKQLLDELDRDVTLKFYFSSSSDQVPVPLKNFAGRVRDLLREYEVRSQGHLVVEEYDPKPDSDEEEWAQRYGLQGQALDMFGLSGDLYFGIVLLSGNNEAVIPVLAPEIEPQLEYHLTRMVAEVAREKTAVVGLITSLPLQGVNLNPMAGGASPKWTFISEVEQQYDVRNLGRNPETIPDDIDTLLVVHPTGIPESGLYAIDQFVLRGGHLLVFADPLCLAAQESFSSQMQQMGMQPPSMASDLNRLTSAWGITISTNQLVCDESAATLLDAGEGRVQRNPAFLSLREDNVNTDDVATVGLSNLMLPFAGTFTGTVSNGLQATDLLWSSNDGFLVGTAAARAGQFQLPDETASLPLAVRLQGTFSTAFPDGRPEPAGEPDPDSPPPEPPAHLSSSTAPGVVVLVADADMLYDRFCMENINIFGQVLAQPFNENLGFALNMIEQLCGSDLLIGLRSRGSFDRPFDRVVEMERNAAFQWQAEEDRLNEKLMATQQKLAALEQAQGEGQQLMLTPEQEREVEAFREEVFQTRQALKEVRKNLRRDIEQLGTRLKMINILAIPLWVAAYGIARGFWFRRTR